MDMGDVNVDLITDGDIMDEFIVIAVNDVVVSNIWLADFVVPIDLVKDDSILSGVVLSDLVCGDAWCPDVSGNIIDGVRDDCIIEEVILSTVFVLGIIVNEGVTVDSKNGTSVISFEDCGCMVITGRGD